MEINGSARKLVQKVSKESIATAGNNGNGASQPDVEVAAAGNSSHGKNGSASNGHGGNGNGRNWNWVNRLKQLSGVVEQEI